MNGSQSKISPPQPAQFIWISKEITVSATAIAPHQPTPRVPAFAPLRPLRQWLDTVPVNHPRLAKLICRWIPARCPFERTITVFGHELFHIPPLCKLNPLYEQFVGLRFRALCYLADECGEDISEYC